MPAGSGPPLLEPGDAHPFPLLDAAALARFVHVEPVAVRRWLDEGLPADAAGRVDPFAAANWLSWGRLDRCPALARRWRTYLLWFAPLVTGDDRPRRLRWRRSHRLCLPGAADAVRWWLPRPASTAGQTVLAEQPLLGEGLVASDGALAATTVAGSLVAHGVAEVALVPRRVLAPGVAEHGELAALVEQVAGGFRYAYRHHRPWEYPEVADGGRVTARWEGSCLDCALALASLLAERGRRWRLCGGIVAHTAIANPHFWLEAETTAGWAPLDPTLPAIVRMLGGDWRACARAYTGAGDARRIELHLLDATIGIPGGPTLGGAVGEAVVTIAGERRNAWPCLDWVGGECEGEFEEC
jgi:hypothetical protein